MLRNRTALTEELTTETVAAAELWRPLMAERTGCLFGIFPSPFEADAFIEVLIPIRKPRPQGLVLTTSAPL